MCLVALASAGWNARYAGHHVIIGRDPGIYAVTGKWIATHGDLEVHTGTDWTSKSANVNPVYTGSYARGPNVTQYQFDSGRLVLRDASGATQATFIRGQG